MSSKPYTGPSVPDMIRSKTLAQNIVKYHNHSDSDSILDESNLDMLHRFVSDPSQREQILQDAGVDPQESLKGKQASLAAYVVWAHGRDDMNGGILKDSDVDMLRSWFEKDGGRRPVRVA